MLMVVHSSKEEENILVNLLTKTFLTIYVESIDYRYWTPPDDNFFLKAVRSFDDYFWPDERTLIVFKTLVELTQGPIFEICCKTEKNPFNDISITNSNVKEFGIGIHCQLTADQIKSLLKAFNKTHTFIMRARYSRDKPYAWSASLIPEALEGVLKSFAEYGLFKELAIIYDIHHYKLGLKAVTPFIQNSSTLQDIKLIADYLPDEDNMSYPSEADIADHMSKIYSLDLDSWIPSVSLLSHLLSQASNLTTLNVPLKNLKEDKTIPLETFLNNTTSLRNLTLYSSDQEKFLDTLSQSSALSQLESLAIYTFDDTKTDNLDEKTATTLVNQIFSNSSLHTLKLAGKSLTQAFTSHHIHSQNIHLKTLHLHSVPSYDHILEINSPDLEDFMIITHNFSINTFNEVIEKLGAFLQHHPSLTSFTFNGRQQINASLTTWPKYTAEQIRDHTSLQSLIIDAKALLCKDFHWNHKRNKTLVHYCEDDQPK